MHPIYRNLDTIPITKISDQYNYNPSLRTFYSQDKQSPIQSQSVMVMNKNNKNGIALVKQNIQRASNMPPQTTDNQGVKSGLFHSQSPTQSHSQSSPQSIEVSDILPALKELELRVVALSETVLHHEQLLQSTQQSKTSVGTDESIKSLSAMIQEQVERKVNQFSLSPRTKESSPSSAPDDSRFLLQISSLKEELHRESKDKSMHDRKYFTDLLKRETQAQTLSMYQANREVFRRIQIDMSELRQLIETARQPFNEYSSSHESSQLFSSSKKFYDPRIVRYREVMERISENGFNKPISDPVVINEIIYYLDKEGNLLDSLCSYLIDGQGQNIRLEEKHISILKANNLLT